MHLSTRKALYFASRNQNFQYKGFLFFKSMTDDIEKQDSVAASEVSSFWVHGERVLQAPCFCFLFEILMSWRWQCNSVSLIEPSYRAFGLVL